MPLGDMRARVRDDRPRGAGRVPGGPATRIGKHQRRIRPAAHQPDDRQHLIQVDGAAPLGGLSVALDLGGHGRAQPEAPDHDLFGELVHSVLDRGVQVSEGLEQAEWDEGGNGGFRHGNRRRS